MDGERGREGEWVGWSERKGGCRRDREAESRIGLRPLGRHRMADEVEGPEGRRQAGPLPILGLAGPCSTLESVLRPLLPPRGVLW